MLIWGGVQGTPTQRVPDNAFMGYLVGYANTTGSSNVFVGAFSGSANTSGSSNAFIGYFAGHTNSTGNSDTFVGTGAGEYNTTGSGNAFLGYAAGFRNTTGFNNSFLGYGAGQSNTTGSYNTYMGGGAAILNITGSQNVFLGNDAGYFSTSNTQNTLVGYQSGYNSNGDANTFLGHQSGFDNTSGLRNVAVGQKAGANNQTGSDNVFVGYGAKAGTANPTNVTNAVAIGANAVVSQSNSMVLGSRLNVGIGNSAPSAKLHITAGVANTSGLRLENLTSSSPATLLNRTKFLSVDGSGNVVLASVNGSARESAPEAVWQQEGKYLHNVTGDGVVIGQGVSKMPDGYALFVANGILTEKVKVAIKNTTDWSDHVFAKNYPLRSLHEVDQYIQQTGHLPGIPSAMEVVKNGVDLGKMDAILLEKIEEITLYLIDLQKEVATLRRENQALKHENAKIGKRLNASVYKARN
ncbi:bZIP transcription factor [Spirosoma sp. KNUC1025]|uniref:bZIP transcription factor n=1 Tax=Spirosoma sp. KNUC1025 TaxID=2894082 RepID=UPI00386D1401|nr:bZIP transcription factor [Spirosoma sp. KNUC1025]